MSRLITGLSDGDSPCHVGSGTTIDLLDPVVSFEEIENSALQGTPPPVTFPRLLLHATEVDCWVAWVWL